jgi:hypothetical protein
MRDIIHTYNKTKILHHAYAIEGEKEAALKKLYLFLENEVGVSVAANPDLFRDEFETFGIDDGRALKERAFGKAFLGGMKIFILVFTAITREAQNSLLKLFEEPPQRTHFFVLVPSAHILLPTLRSRMFLASAKTERKGHDEFTGKFLSAGKAKRIDMLKGIIDDKDRRKSLRVLNNIEEEFYRAVRLENAANEHIALFEEIAKLRKDLDARSMSVKMILEHISLITPLMRVKDR